MDKYEVKTSYDFAVIGAGAMGASAALHLATQGASVLILDRFTPPHDQGSSHGETRLLRVAYAEGAKYVPFVKRAIHLWRALEERTGAELFCQSGVIYAGSPSSEFISRARDSSQTHNVKLQTIDHSDLAEIAPQFAPPSDWDILFESDGGYLYVEKCVSHMLKLAEQHGARTAMGTRVKDICRNNGSYRINTDIGNFDADSVIVTAGAWAADLLPELSKKLTLQRRVLHWFDSSQGDFSGQSGFKPFVAHIADSDSWYYGFPDVTGAGVKVANHHAGHNITHADDMDRRILPGDYEQAEIFARRFLPALGSRLVSKPCIYTTSDDEDFFIDELPNKEKLFVCTGFSGHGFKFAAAVGEAVGDLALRRQTKIDLSPFSLSR
jgi:sarcosine oxidase